MSGNLMLFKTSNTERMRIDSSGTLIHKAAAVFNEDGGDNDFRVESDTLTHALFVQGSDGNIGIGETSPQSKIHLGRVGSRIAFGQTDASAGGPFGLNFYDDTTASSAGIGMRFYYRTGSESITIEDRNEAVLHKLDKNGNVVFNEQGLDADFRVESNADTHALFVNAGGEFISMGNTVKNPVSGFSDQIGFGFDIASGQAQFAANTAALQLGRVSASATGDIVAFRSASNVVGSISITSSGTTYNTTSDRRLKDNITTITDGKEKLLAMNPITHTWKADPDAPAVHGFIAQEMQEVIPEAVSGDAESDDMMSMDYGRITPVIVATLQEALNEIDSLKRRVKELENK